MPCVAIDFQRSATLKAFTLQEVQLGTADESPPEIDGCGGQSKCFETGGQHLKPARYRAMRHPAFITYGLHIEHCATGQFGGTKELFEAVEVANINQIANVTVDPGPVYVNPD